MLTTLEDLRNASKRVNALVENIAAVVLHRRADALLEQLLDHRYNLVVVRQYRRVLANDNNNNSSKQRC